MVKNQPKQPEDPVPLSEAIAELAKSPRQDVLKEAEERRLAAQKIAQRRLLEGSAEHHRELLADPDADPDAKADSRLGVHGDEADLLAVDPTAHDQEDDN